MSGHQDSVRKRPYPAQEQHSSTQDRKPSAQEENPSSMEPPPKHLAPAGDFYDSVAEAGRALLNQINPEYLNEEGQLASTYCTIVDVHK